MVCLALPKDWKQEETVNLVMLTGKSGKAHVKLWLILPFIKTHLYAQCTHLKSLIETGHLQKGWCFTYWQPLTLPWGRNREQEYLLHLDFHQSRDLKTAVNKPPSLTLRLSLPQPKLQRFNLYSVLSALTCVSLLCFLLLSDLQCVCNLLGITLGIRTTGV